MNPILQADCEILGAAFFFGLGFIGQRAVSIDGLGPMTCNALRFALSALFLLLVLPWIPSKYLSVVQAALVEGGEEEEGEEKDLEDKKRAPISYQHHPDDSSEVFVPSTLTPTAMALLMTEEELKANRRETLSWLHRLFGPQHQLYRYYTEVRKSTLFWGVLLGVINFFGSSLQQWGITMTSVNKVAFIAGFDLFLTPILALCIPTFKRNGKPTLKMWLAVGIAMLGLFYLSDASLEEISGGGVDGQSSLGLGEQLTLVSTFFWTLHITYTDLATCYVNAIQMTQIQLVVVAVLSSVLAVALEPQSWLFRPGHMGIWLWMIFIAVVEGIGFVLMALGQSFAPATHAALLLSLEGVFTSILSYLLLGETLTFHELFGCALMLGATYQAKVGCIPTGWMENFCAGSTNNSTALSNGGSTSMSPLSGVGGGKGLTTFIVSSGQHLWLACSQCYSAAREYCQRYHDYRVSGENSKNRWRRWSIFTGSSDAHEEALSNLQQPGVEEQLDDRQVEEAEGSLLTPRSITSPLNHNAGSAGFEEIAGNFMGGAGGGFTSSGGRLNRSSKVILI
eukprot:gene4249-4666_t